MRGGVQDKLPANSSLCSCQRSASSPPQETPSSERNDPEQRTTSPPTYTEPSLSETQHCVCPCPTTALWTKPVRTTRSRAPPSFAVTQTNSKLKELTLTETIHTWQQHHFCTCTALPHYITSTNTSIVIAYWMPLLNCTQKKCQINNVKLRHLNIFDKINTAKSYIITSHMLIMTTTVMSLFKFPHVKATNLP